MEKVISNKVRELISILLLTVLAAIFVHSEIGLKHADETIHVDHDYCQIIDNVSSQNNGFDSARGLKLRQCKDISIGSINVVFHKEVVNLSIYPEEFFKPPKSIEIFLFNNSFLI